MDSKEQKIIYANNAELKCSTFDFQLNLIHEESSNDRIDSVKIYMSPQHAKSLMLLLQQAIEEYEDSFGEINLEPQKSITDTNE